MGKSARVLGWEFGKTAAEMNQLFKEYGYLEGEPGAWRPTEKGSEFAEDHYHDNGYGGYAHRSWETRTWSQETGEALRADIEAAPTPTDDNESYDMEFTDEVVFDHDPSFDQESNDDGLSWGWKELAVAGVVIGTVLIAPRVRPFYENKVKPAAQNLRDRLTKREPAEQRKQLDTDQEHSDR